MPISGTNIRLLSLPDSSAVRGTTSDRDGQFHMENLEPDNYLLEIRYLGYRPYFRRVDLKQQSLPVANAEDLVRRMPGFLMQDGRHEAQGEEIERVEVYDRRSG